MGPLHAEGAFVELGEAIWEHLGAPPAAKTSVLLENTFELGMRFERRRSLSCVVVVETQSTSRAELPRLLQSFGQHGRAECGLASGPKSEIAAPKGPARP